jgi:uncharacterized protein
MSGDPARQDNLAAAYCRSCRDHPDCRCFKETIMPTNVLGTELKCCCRDPLTGFYRDGFCRTGSEDIGQHTVCVQVTREFLDFSVLDGNDLVTPIPEWGFPGLKPGDRWCVCVTRWKAALEHGRAAPVDLEATHASALEFVTLEDLQAYALKS